MSSEPLVFYAYSSWNQECVDALASEPIELHTVQTWGDEGFWEFLHERWAIQKTFVLVEHDIRVYPGAIQEIWDCPISFCGKPYQIHATWSACFGCTKFGRELMQRYPQAMEEAGKRRNPKGAGAGYKHWETLDSRVVATLWDLGWRGYDFISGLHGEVGGPGWPHQHFPPVEHRHSYSRSSPPDWRSQ